MDDVFSIKGHNYLGNVCVGILLLGLGVFVALPSSGVLPLICALFLFAMACVSLYICVSARRERPDEMFVAHDGQASSHALKLTLILVGGMSALGMATNACVSLAAAGCITLGFALLAYGVCFAKLESGDDGADYEDA